MSNQHTPTPWFVICSTDGWTIRTKPDGTGAHVARQYVGSPVSDAAMIVKAVNAHDKLVEALRNLEVAANTAQHCYDFRPENFAFAMTQLQHDAECARAALTALEEA